MYCFIGVLLGTLIGVLPGIGPVATISMLLPATFVLPPVSALIMLAGIYYGAQYGGSTTAILVNLPGEVSSVVTCLDGYQMARQGKAGKALGVAALASFFAGTVATVLIAAFAPPLAEFALKFGPADYFSLMVLGLIAAVVLAHGSLIKAIAMIVFGLPHRPHRHRRELGSGALQLQPPGADRRPWASAHRHGQPSASARSSATSSRARSARCSPRASPDCCPTGRTSKQSAMPTIRGTALGSMLGILPGGGPVLGAFRLHAREEDGQGSEPFRQGSDRGRGRPRVREQRRGADLVHSRCSRSGIPSNR
jgi:TctA family transporter